MKNLLFLLLVGSLFSCHKESETPSNLEEYTAESVLNFDEFATRLQASAFEMFDSMLDDVNEYDNLVFSPLSIQFVLAMLANGAKGETLDEIKQVMHLDDETVSGMNAMFHNLIASTMEEDDFNSLNIANGVFWDGNIAQLESGFQQRIERNFHGECFGDQFESELINNWISDRTDGEIESLIDEIDGEELFFHINTMLFSADWESNKWYTSETEIVDTLSDGHITSYERMFTKIRTRFDIVDDVIAFVLPFKDPKYEVLIIQPFDSNLQNLLEDQSFDWAISFLIDEIPNQNTELELLMPKFKLVENKKDLIPMLKDVGLKNTFENNADFTEMFSNSIKSKVEKMDQVVKFELDENGVDGSVTTVAGGFAVSAGFPLTLDSPFLFSLRTTDNHIPLFLGKVGDPGKE